VIETVLPTDVVAVEAFGDPAEARTLPEEGALVAGAVEKRRREFTTGRWVAHQAIRRLGVRPGPLLSGERGEPLWPDGVVGSITHCDGYRATAVGRAAQWLGVGIDAEPNGPLPEGVLAAIGRPEERARTALLLRATPAVRWDRLLFSAKEAVYKALYPATGQPLDFEDATVSFQRPVTFARPAAAEDPVGLDGRAGTFTARILAAGPAAPALPAVVQGRWVCRNGLLVTTAAVPRTATGTGETFHRATSASSA
jgi:enterobactin synthetase component D / holo-[acyl-carrier protein] synthase